MSEKFVPSRGRKQCPSCGGSVGVRSRVCKHCEYNFYLPFQPQIRGPAIKFIAACGGMAQARVALREAEKFLREILEFKRKYLTPESVEVESAEVESAEVESAEVEPTE